MGNWANEALLKGEIFDTVLADYLLGAIEGFAPYFQPWLFPRLRPLTRGALYVTGLEPYVPTARPQTKAGRLIWEIGRFRDACILLSGHLPYREYPAGWTLEHIKRAGFSVREVKHFTIGYKEKFINAQIDIAIGAIRGAPDAAMAQALSTRGEALRTEAIEEVNASGALRHCRNYVISAAPE